MTTTTFVYAVVAAGALLALWFHARTGRSPQSIAVVLAHLVVSFVLLELAPVLMERSGGAELSRGEAVAGMLLFFLPAITYAFVASIFLLVRLQQALRLR